MLSFEKIQNNPQVLEFIQQSDDALAASGYTEHSLSHASFVSDRARIIAKKIGFSKQEQELASIAGFCHDMGNFLSRSQHHYLGALLFHQIFQQDFSPKELAIIIQAISSHDKDEMTFSAPISAIVVLADKTDVRRSRVVNKKKNRIMKDIHDRVNYATTISNIKIDKKKKLITSVLKIDSNFVPIMEYFEIFTDRMIYCRKAAEFLGYKFGLVINNFKLL
jgi:hypothetical protein